MGRKNTKGTQKVNPIIDASIEPPPYETALGMSNTEEVKKRGKQDKHNDFNSCNCKKYNNICPIRTWESITNLYGDVDTTKVWDSQQQKAKTLFSPKLPKKETRKAIIDKSGNNNVVMYPTSNLKSTPAKLSLIDLYRKHKNNRNKIQTEQHANANSMDIHVKSSPYPEPKVKFLLSKKSKKVKPNYATGDILMEEPSRNALEKVNYLHDLKYTPYKTSPSFIGKMFGNTIDKYKNNNENTKTLSNVNNDNSKREKNKTKTKEKKITKKSKNKHAKSMKTQEEYGNVGYGDQISPIPLKKQDLQDLQCKCSFFGKMMGHTICKCKNNNGRTRTSRKFNDHTVDPLLEMKVNLKDMSVINSSEIDKKVRKLGRTEKNRSCVCPSKRLNDDRVCERGPCEKALENQHTFDCKCRKQTQNIIECKDSTCDLKFRDIKVRSRNKKKPLSRVYTNDKKPLFEVMLDPTKMKIINSKELKDIIKNSPQTKICPTGICNTMSKQKNIQLNCKCVGKKMSPLVSECEDRICRNPEKKGKISCLCSRVFSKSENWTGQKENRMRRPIRGNGYGTNMKRNGVMINLPRGRTPKEGTNVGGTLSDVWCKCLCECDTKKPEKSLVKKKTIKKNKKRRRRKGFFRKKKEDHRTLKEKFLDCLEREQEHCEKKVKKKTKEYKQNEKNTIKENKKIEKEQKKDFSKKKYELNCLTNVIIGVVNVGLESIGIAFKVALSVIGHPLSSYIYVKEKIKNPPAAVDRVIKWFIRTWRKKTSAFARGLEESDTLKVIADQIESSPIYNALVVQGTTPEERMIHERRLRKRKRRMQKRQEEAVYGCRHVLLLTMRKTPCIWFYHICPELYPQCLGVSQFMTNFLHIILFCGAVMCWTPCIVACEMCRAFLCCFLCTN